MENEDIDTNRHRREDAGEEVVVEKQRVGFAGTVFLDEFSVSLFPNMI